MVDQHRVRFKKNELELPKKDWEQVKWIENYEEFLDEIS